MAAIARTGALNFAVAAAVAVAIAAAAALAAFEVPELRKYPELREAQKSKSSYFSHTYKSCVAKVVVRWPGR